MANAIIAYGNMTDAATLSGGSWLAALPLTNLQNRLLGILARSTDDANASTKFDVDLGGPRIARVVSLANHTLSLNALYRVRFGDDPAFATTAYDSGWLDVWPAVYPFGSVPWGSPSWWSGQLAEDEIPDTATLCCIFDDSISGRYLRIEFDDTTNPAGYLDLGRLFIADGWQPDRNMVYGAGLGWLDRSTVQEAISGAEWFTVRPGRRSARIDFTGMTESEAMAEAYELQRIVGTTGEILFIFDPDDAEHAGRRQWLGRLRTLNMIENPGPNRWRAPFDIQEIL